MLLNTHFLLGIQFFRKKKGEMIWRLLGTKVHLVILTMNPGENHSWKTPDRGLLSFFISPNSPNLNPN
jgi:hypothetical protein